MKYFFILGNNQALSVAEILSWLESAGFDFQVETACDSYLLLDVYKNLPEDLLNQLGGTIKFGQILDKIQAGSITKETVVKLLKPADKKYNFGFSVYPENKKLSFKLRGMGLDIKKEFKSKGIPSRLVMSRQENLSSVVVKKNKMLGQSGAELVFLLDNNNIYLGKTLAVQPFASLSQRDFGRPGRDDFSGMLPPKLAQIMINLAKVKSDEIVLDPFCGSGTILQELLLRGFINVYGSDISEKAVADSQKNIDWLVEKFSVNSQKVKIFKSDIKKLSSLLKIKADKIITEPFLGPPARGKRSKVEIKKIFNDLTIFYKDVFTALPKVLKPAARVVIVFPVLSSGRKDFYLPKGLIVNKNFKQVCVLPRGLRSIYKLSSQKTLVYQRAGQQVKREILVFEYAG